jgi:triphosphoribosyl-dephospho-CoA synthetase
MTIILPYATEHALAAYITKLAVRALYFEVKAYPKPGLVSFVDMGAHQDMNGTTFYRSLIKLRHYFYTITRHALQRKPFIHLQAQALDAEQQMLVVTRGVNTHRGAIFTLGLLSVSVARLWKKPISHHFLVLHHQLINDWQYLLSHHYPPITSHGGCVRCNYKVISAREMAMQGYPIIFQVLPAFLQLYHTTKSLDISCLYAYLVFLINIDDTNILYRQGQAGLRFAKQTARALLAVHCVYKRQQKALVMHQLFSKQGISPGGVADLLSALIFIAQLYSKSLRCHY